jgi:gamma-glutamylaminecyclotransferase
MMRRTILFVYGTLKRGLCNHRLIADQEYLGEARTEPRYRVIDLGPHPGLVLDEVNGLAVRGELWSVSECCLAELDEFEEEAGAFIRSGLRIAGRAEPVQAYFWNRPIPEGAALGSMWPPVQRDREEDLNHRGTENTEKK